MPRLPNRNTGLPAGWPVVLRVACSGVVLVVFASLFTDIHALMEPQWVRLVARFQFLPSLLSFVQEPAPAALFFVFVLALTLLFGRAYCSFLCPLGALFDLIRRLAGRKKNRFSPSRVLLRYSVLVVCGVTLATGSAYVAGLLDPFSMFGRLAATLARPVAALANNGASRALETGGFYWLAPVPVSVAAFSVVSFLGAVFLLLAYLAARHGRLYCNTVCPVGAFLGLLARVSRNRFFIAPGCTSRGRCERTCRASCINVAAGIIDMERCVGCFDCTDSCPEGVVRFGVAERKDVVPQEKTRKKNPTRRGFLVGLALLPGALPFARRARANNPPPTPVDCDLTPAGATVPTSPPTSGSIAAFLDACTGCQLCVRSCPTSVLAPTLAAYGPGGFLLPRLDFHRGFCNYTCTTCTEVCPTGALRPVTVTDKKTIQLGKAVFVRENCVVAARKTACGACAEHCPTKAVRMVPAPDLGPNLTIPALDNDICVGCGACEYACPTRPFRAIHVQGNPVHARAEAPPEQPALEPATRPGDPFGF